MTPVSPIVTRVSQRHGIDPALVEAVIWQESSYKSDAVSTKGAMGLIQLMPATAKEMSVAHPLSSKENIEGDTRYLAMKICRFNSPRKPLIAYHCGDTHARVKNSPRECEAYAAQVLEKYYRIRSRSS